MSAESGSAGPLRLGARIAGRFVVGPLLGKGGTGTVYRGDDCGSAASLLDRSAPNAETPESARPVVLKVMHPHLFEHEQVRGRFVREAAILRHLDGPFLCPVLEAGETDEACGVAGLPYLVLPYVDGRALDETLQRDGLPDPEIAAALVRDICLALAHAHERGVFHRDLKPANVLVDASWRPTVIDFGLAKILGFGSGTTNLTESGMLFGTPEYMAPEQVRGEEVDARSDVWAAGCVLYEALTGARPFAARTPVATMNAILGGVLAAPRDRAPARDIPRAVDAVVKHALAKAPEHRYASAAAMADALSRALEAPEDAEAVAPARVSLLPEFAPRSRTVVAQRRNANSAERALREDLALGHAATDLDLRVHRAPGSGASLGPATPRSPMFGEEPAPKTSSLRVTLAVVLGLLAVAAGVALALRK